MPGRLTNIWDMKTTEINQSIIGKRCECMFTGIMVKGTITEIEE